MLLSVYIFIITLHFSLVAICHDSCVCRLGCLLTCRTITLGQAHFLTYSRIRPPPAAISVALWVCVILEITTLHFSLVLICHDSCKIGCLLTCCTITVGQAHFLTYSHIQTPLATIFLVLWVLLILQMTTLHFSLVAICQDSCVCRLGCLLTCRTITVGHAHFLTYSHIRPPLAAIFL